MIRYLGSTIARSFSKKYLHPPLLQNHRILFLTFSSTKFFASNQDHQDKISTILSSVTLNMNNEVKNILQSKIVTNFRFQQQNDKVVISLSIAKDFVKIKNILIRKFNSHGYGNVEVVLEPKKDHKIFQPKGNTTKIKKIIAVSSCKGGVGKSTVAVNVAFTLKQQGFKVGILDADIYGPSLPTLLNKQGEILQHSKQNPNHIVPKMANGVKCMSFGFVANQPAAMRGPMASSIVAQLFLQTLWEDLDYLIVDMPPGTGDVNLTICEQLKLDGAIIVTTPQKLSFIDVLKGIQMFQDLRVKILAVVENMSHYSCPKCTTKQQIFGKGHCQIIKDQLGIQNSFKIPLDSLVNKYSEIGIPLVTSQPPQATLKQTYKAICKSVCEQIEKPKIKSGAFYSTAERLVIVEEGNRQKKIGSVQLRSKCKCHECVNQQTGQKILKNSQIDPEVYPVKIEQKGNYAIGITWSDGHKNSIYSFKRLFSNEILQK